MDAGAAVRRLERMIPLHPRLTRSSLWLALPLALVSFLWPVYSAPAAERGLSYLDNGTIRLGVDLDRGGAIVWLSRSKGAADGPAEPPNVVNNFDHGRQVQMSFYSGPVPFTAGDKRPAKHWEHLGWNPVQAGDDFGHGSRVIEHENDGRQLRVKCVPLQWPLDNVESECALESWITLEGNRVLVRGRLVNRRSDHTQYPAMRQELPAIYVNGPYHRLLTYTGERPFTEGPLSRIERRPDDPAPWATFTASEHWAALVDEHDWGLGVWSPDASLFAGGFAGEPGQGGTHDSPTGYLSPTLAEVLDHNIEYEFRYVLVLGDLAEIRRSVYQRPERPAPPEYRFARDRQHWHFVSAADQGWPIEGELRLKLDQDDPQLIGPEGFWQATDAPRLYIHGAWPPGPDQAEVFFKTAAEPDFSPEKKVTLPLIPDGQYRVYSVDLSQAAGYRGGITGLRFDPLPEGRSGTIVRLRSIGFREPKPAGDSPAVKQ